MEWSAVVRCRINSYPKDLNESWIFFIFGVHHFEFQAPKSVKTD